MEVRFLAGKRVFLFTTMWSERLRQAFVMIEIRSNSLGVQNQGFRVKVFTRCAPSVKKVTIKSACPYLYIYIERERVKLKWSRYRPDVVQRVGRGVTLLFHDRGTRRG